jgi:hypothetical protein
MPTGTGTAAVHSDSCIADVLLMADVALLLL